MKWTVKQIEQVKKAVGTNPSMAKYRALADRFGSTETAVRCLVQRLNGVRGKSARSKTVRPQIANDFVLSDNKEDREDLIDQIVRLSCKHAVAAGSICTKLGLSEKALYSLIDKAAKRGYVITVTDGYVSTRVPTGARGTIVLGGSKPGRHSFLQFTDIHFGSKYCDLTALAETFRMARKLGITTAVCTGDVLDGFKGVLIHEQRRVGYDGQVDEAVSFMKKEAKGFSIVAIDGNHDGYHSNAIGFVSGEILAERMRAAGVDWQFAGVCLGRAIVNGAHVQLWHPHGGAGTRNAVRRILNSRAETLEERCDILLIGHFHKFATVATYPEGVFCAAGGTYQRKGSEFANRISGGWDIGGSIISYDVDSKGRVSHVAAEFMPTNAARAFEAA